MAERPEYPVQREADVILRDGSTVRVRPVRPGDETPIVAFLRGLSEEARVLRFFGPVPDAVLADRARREVDVDYVRRFGLVATAGPEERIVGLASYSVTDGDRAEVSLAAADDYQGRGLGTILLGHLAEVASGHGILAFEALVLPRNRRMLDVFRDAGFPTNVRFNGWELEVSFPTSLTEDALLRFDRRDQVAAANALRVFLNPRAVAVIGASRRRGTIGGEIFHNLLGYGFARERVYPVNPAAEAIEGVRAFPTAEEIPGPVDLAVVAVPATQVPGVAEQCARKGIRALVVISAGFAEAGEEGRARHAELLRICRAAGMRLIGPNCMGILNTDPEVRLNATFAPHTPPAGRVGFLSQSGALGLAIIEYATSLGLGLSTFVSAGNKADVSGNDLLNYWESDPRTGVILLYLESFGNPRRFARIARRVGRTKPIVVKSGRSLAGARATSSHTGALVSASDATVDALFRQTGVIRTATLEELFDVAALLAHQPPPRDRRVAIVTNGGGPGILCADRCEAEGLEVAPLAEDTQARLRAFLPAHASVQNPVDLTASGPAAYYQDAVRLVAADPNVDALIVIFVPPLVTEAGDVARAILEGSRGVQGSKPVLTVFMSARGVPDFLRAGDARIPSYAFPESAAMALARAARYGDWRQRPVGMLPRFEDIDREEAAGLVASALGRGGGWATPDETWRLLSCYGLPVAVQRTAAAPEQAGRAAEELGGAVALKAAGPEIVHKAELGAVRLGLRGPQEVRAAAEEMVARLGATGHPPETLVVQLMAPPGVEMIVGVVHDRDFGPVVACGAGGSVVELLKDVSIRLAPLTQQDTSQMVRELKTYPLLIGFRGRPVADAAALEQVLLRVGALADDLPQVAELDCNPVIVHAQGAVIVDARVRIAPFEAPPLLGRRR